MSYAGDLTPSQAWELLQAQPDAVLVDVRTQAEWTFVGVPDLSQIGKQPLLVEWSSMQAGPDPAAFLQAVTAVVEADTPIVLLCRSGHRSVAAAQTLTAAGYGCSYNIEDGFEGPLDAAGHRGARGWRADGLPWRQQ
ncbi:MAG: rhodanese-like domain-containing protein [Beutenbergiaceae bacterium]